MQFKVGDASTTYILFTLVVQTVLTGVVPTTGYFILSEINPGISDMTTTINNLSMTNYSRLEAFFGLQDLII